MPDMVEPTPSERDEAIYLAWEEGKGLRSLAREFKTSVAEIERVLDRSLPTFDAQTSQGLRP
jgi:Mor family transcriptional regulator